MVEHDTLNEQVYKAGQQRPLVVNISERVCKKILKQRVISSAARNLSFNIKISPVGRGDRRIKNVCNALNPFFQG